MVILRARAAVVVEDRCWRYLGVLGAIARGVGVNPDPEFLFMHA